MRLHFSSLAVVLASSAFVACATGSDAGTVHKSKDAGGGGGETAPGPDGANPDEAGTPDAIGIPDFGGAPDVDGTPDTTPVLDTSTPPDASPPDTSTPPDVTPIPDTTPPPDVVPPPDATPDAVGPPTGHVGAACSTNADCTGAVHGLCTSKLYSVGPLDPTSICVAIDVAGSTDVCDPTATTAAPLCDGGNGYCTKNGASPSSCSALCQIDKFGTFTRACAGTNSCGPQIFDGTGTTYGVCQGGCTKDSDCPSGSGCDVADAICTKTCTSDAQCTLTGSTTFKCNVAAGHCEFTYPKALGALCTSASDCLCMMGATATSGYCTTQCQTGTSTCASGYTCDALISSTDSTGATVITYASQPSGLAGNCAKACTSAADCTGSGQVCGTSAGMTQSTCRPGP